MGRLCSGFWVAVGEDAESEEERHAILQRTACASFSAPNVAGLRWVRFSCIDEKQSERAALPGCFLSPLRFGERVDASYCGMLVRHGHRYWPWLIMLLSG